MLGLQLVIIWNAGFRTGLGSGGSLVWISLRSNGKSGKELRIWHIISRYIPIIFYWYFSIRVFLNLNELIGNPISNGILLLSMIQCVLIMVTGVLLFKVKQKIRIEQMVLVGIWSATFILVGLSRMDYDNHYSDSSGIIFPLFLIWLYLKEKESDRMAKKAIYIFLLLAVSMIGFQIKPMALIVLIRDSDY